MANKLKSKRPAGEPAVAAQRRSSRQAAFLEAISGGLTIRDACAFSGIDRRTQHRWRSENKKFEAEFRATLAQGTISLIREAHRRAVKGIAKPQFYQGRPVIDPETGEQLIVREYSDTLLMFLAKAREPETFDDNIRAKAWDRRKRKRDEADGTGDTPAGELVDMLTEMAAAKARTALGDPGGG